MSDPTPSVLHAKIAAILAQMSGVPKTGWNDFHKYHYIQESDVLDTLRPALAQANISVQVSIEKSETQEVLQGTKLLTTVGGWMCFTDADTGEMLQFGICGQGMDNQDKGVPKAITMAVKYGLMKTFLLGTPDDAERDEQAPNRDALSGRDLPPPVPPVGTALGEVPGPAPRAEQITDRLPWETDEEAAAAVAAAAAVPGPAIGGTPAPPSNGKLISEAQGRLLFGRAKGKGVPDAERDRIIQHLTGQPKIDGVPWDKMDAILEAYESYAAHHGTG